MVYDEAAAQFDARLVSRVRAGEAVAFQELFTRYRSLVYGLAARLLNDKNEADDICQEVFLAIHRRLGSLREPEKLRAWICRITLTRVYNTERSFRRRFRALTISLGAEEHVQPPATAPAGDPERALVSAEARRRIDDALAGLPFAYRTVVVLRDIEGLTYQEIADALETNTGTVKSRLARGREALRGSLHDLLQWHMETRP